MKNQIPSKLFAKLVMLAMGLLLMQCNSMYNPQFENIDKTSHKLKFDMQDINAKDEQGRTNLHLAAIEGDTEVGNLLLQHGPDVNLPDKLGKTALHYACQNGKIAFSRMLIEYTGIELDAVDHEGKTPLHLAAQAGYLPITELLLKRRVNVNAKDLNNQTPLHLAAQAGHLAVVEWLLDNGARPGLGDKADNFPIHQASRGGHTAIVKTLLACSNNVNINVQNQQKATPLMLAIAGAHVETAQLLLLNGGSAVIKDELGNTPLHVAFKKGLMVLVQPLLNNGANLNAKNNEGLTPVEVAQDISRTFEIANNPHAPVRQEILIRTPDDLASIEKKEGYPLDGIYRIVADIDLGGRKFSPIGSKDKPFEGTLYGDGHCIANLYIEEQGMDCVGLLSCLGKKALVQGIHIKDAKVRGSAGVGILAGANEGVIKDCQVTGLVRGCFATGGLVGENNTGACLTNCQAIIQVIGEGWHTGGLLGRNNGYIAHCYATGEVVGKEYVGGLVGDNSGYGVIKSCYATGQVNGVPNVGSLVGLNLGRIFSSDATNLRTNNQIRLVGVTENNGTIN